MKEKLKKFWDEHKFEITTISACVAALGFSHHAHTKRVEGLVPKTCDYKEYDEFATIRVNLKNGNTHDFICEFEK